MPVFLRKRMEEFTRSQKTNRGVSADFLAVFKKFVSSISNRMRFVTNHILKVQALFFHGMQFDWRAFSSNSFTFGLSESIPHQRIF